jgi:hypothetical protein
MSEVLPTYYEAVQSQQLHFLQDKGGTATTRQAEAHLHRFQEDCKVKVMPWLTDWPTDMLPHLADSFWSSSFFDELTAFCQTNGPGAAYYRTYWPVIERAFKVKDEGLYKPLYSQN